MPDAPTCKTCRWFWQDQPFKARLRGQCRKNAPRPVENVTDDWPYVGEYDWCGEHPDRKEGAPDGID